LGYHLAVAMPKVALKVYPWCDTLLKRQGNVRRPATYIATMIQTYKEFYLHTVNLTTFHPNKPAATLIPSPFTKRYLSGHLKSKKC